MKSRCKFRVTGVEWIARGTEKVTLKADYDPEVSKEDAAFSNATPSGEMHFICQNPNLNGSFKPGDTYYVELTPTEEA